MTSMHSSPLINACRHWFVCAVFALVLPWGNAVAQSDITAKVDAVFAEWDKPTSPGCAVGVVRDGSIIYEHGYGMADLENSVRISPETVFYMGSVSKQFTAASVALLALEGRLSLEDDVRKYVPELPQYDAPITINQLIHHMSGVRDYYALMSLAGVSWEDATPQETLDIIARQEHLNFRPGDQYLYSNSGYVLLALIVKRVSGRSLREFAQQQIFGPLGMSHSSFHDDYRIPVDNRAYSYGQDDKDGFKLTFLPKFDLVGAGGVLSTIADLARWDQNFYEPTVGGKDFVDVILTRGILNNGDTLSYAFGNNIGEYKGLRTVSHGGSLMGFRTALLRFPDQRFSVIVLCNLGNINPSGLALQVADIYLSDRFAQSLAVYAGEYYSKELDVTWTVTVADGNLVFDWKQNHRSSRPGQDRDTFRFAGNQVRFVRDNHDAVTGFEVSAGRAGGIVFVRQDP
ncbi:MAG: serine hydrolase domain-containing protein [Gemmatimonadales bacterium]